MELAPDVSFQAFCGIQLRRLRASFDSRVARVQQVRTQHQGTQDAIETRGQVHGYQCKSSRQEME